MGSRHRARMTKISNKAKPPSHIKRRPGGLVRLVDPCSIGNPSPGLGPTVTMKQKHWINKGHRTSGTYIWYTSQLPIPSQRTRHHSLHRIFFSSKRRLKTGLKNHWNDLPRICSTGQADPGPELAAAPTDEMETPGAL